MRHRSASAALTCVGYNNNAFACHLLVTALERPVGASDVPQLSLILYIIIQASHHYFFSHQEALLTPLQAYATKHSWGQRGSTDQQKYLITCMP